MDGDNDDRHGMDGDNDDRHVWMVIMMIDMNGW